LSKPVRAAELHAAIERLMGIGNGTSGILRRPVLPPEVVRNSSLGADSVLDDSVEEDNAPDAEFDSLAETSGQTNHRIDWRIPLASVGDDAELLGEVLEAFLEEVPIRFQELDRSVVRGEHELLRRAAHTLKGGLTMLGIDAAARHAGDIEKLGATARMEGAEGLVARLRQAVDEILPQIKSYRNDIDSTGRNNS